MRSESVISTHPSYLIWLLVPDREKQTYWNLEIDGRKRWSDLGTKTHQRILAELGRFVGLTIALDGEGDGSNFDLEVVQEGSLVKPEHKCERFFDIPADLKWTGFESVRLGVETDALIDDHALEIKPGGSGIKGRYALQLAMNCLAEENPNDAYVYLYKSGLVYCLENGGASIWGICEELVVSGAIIQYCQTRLAVIKDQRMEQKRQRTMGETYFDPEEIEKHKKLLGQMSVVAGRIFYSTHQNINWTSVKKQGREYIISN